MPFDLSKCARPNILALHPYRCARDDYKDDGTNILLDANENAYGPGLALSANGRLLSGHGAINGVEKDGKPLDVNGLESEGKSNGDKVNGLGSDMDMDLSGLNRYPDPHQHDLKQLLCNLRNTTSPTTPHTTNQPAPLTPSNLFLGVGSDEAIDALLRCFCRPAIDSILTCPPTYGMYTVSAQVNDVSVIHVPLDTSNDFALDADRINDRLAQEDADNIKIVYICSPGNPTGRLVDPHDVEKVLRHPTWNGIVVVDEAYIDFAPTGSSLAPWATVYPNVVVMHTLSKGFGLAGIRLGAVFTSPEIASLLNNLKAPYNISALTSEVASRALAPASLEVMEENKTKILQQRDRLIRELPQIKGVGRFLGGFSSNFLLVEILSATNGKGKPCNTTALAVYQGLAERKGVVVRFRGKEVGCEGCLRITVGTEEEVTRFLQELEGILREIFAEGKGKESDGDGVVGNREEERREERASEVVA